MPSIVSAHRWMLAPAPSRCRRSPSASIAVRRDVLRPLQAGAPIAEFWPEPASQRFPSRLALADAVAHPVVWRSLASIVAARLYWSTLAWLLPMQTSGTAAPSMDLRGCGTWASEHGDSCVWPALADTDDFGAAARPTRRWKVDSDARDLLLGQFPCNLDCLVVLATAMPLTYSAHHQSLVLMCCCD